VVQRVFEEEGESAKFRDRTQLLKLLDYCRTRRDIEALIVWKVDRFARNVEDHFAIKKELLRYGTTIHSVTEPISVGPIGRFTETMFAAMAECDNGIRAHRCVEGMQHKIENGIFPWKPPLGYLSANPRGDKKINADVRDPERFTAIKEAWQLILSGSFYKADIVRFFKTRRLTTRSGKPISGQVVDWIFESKYYAGILTDPWENKEYRGKHEAMITLDEYARAQRILKAHSNSSPHIKKRSEFPLRGFVCCRSCLRPITGSWSRGRKKRYAYYHCYSRSCSRYGKGMPRDVLDEKFQATLARYAPQPRLLPVLRSRLQREADSARAGYARKVARHNLRLTALEKENRELIQMRRQKLISDVEFTRDHEILTTEIQTIRGLIGDIQAGHWSETDATDVLDFLASIPSRWNQTPSDFRQRFQKIAFYQGLVEGRFGTAKKTAVFTLIERFRDGKTSGVGLTSDFWNRVFAEISSLAKLIHGSEIYNTTKNEELSDSEDTLDIAA